GVGGLDGHRGLKAVVRRGGGFAFARVLSERSGQLLWHLDHLIAAEPDQASHFVERGKTLQQRGDFTAAAAAFDRAIALDPTLGTAVRSPRANARAELGNWKGAEEDLLAGLAQPADSPVLAPSPEDIRVMLALVRLRRGDERGYRQVCEEFANAARKSDEGSSGPSRVNVNLFWPVLLRANADPALKDLLPPADDLGLWRSSLSISPFNLQLALRYRQGRYAEVVDLLLSDPTPVNYYFLAMAQHRLGNPQAGESLARGIERQGKARATRQADLSLVSGSWQRRVAEDELRREAEELILEKK